MSSEVSQSHNGGRGFTLSGELAGKAFRVSALPGLTRKLTGTVKVHETPPIYVFDTPGIMVPYLGKGQEGLEKGMKLALTSKLATISQIWLVLKAAM